jgi:hypothetical protein
MAASGLRRPPAALDGDQPAGGCPQFYVPANIPAGNFKLQSLQRWGTQLPENLKRPIAIGHARRLRWMLFAARRVRF